ncbi:hypothetical protein QJS10_CPA08g01941 [Acorus calamus]|uniref:GIL1/IRKI C-terminal domain-containing protein n=1 Tax=Acorus calamus TaxID=4465 RepID=A0AAV9EAP5_ACOCL|nr:hypothetical protein QJS10_CPA08g01941 [Acorus calamus]
MNGGHPRTPFYQAFLKFAKAICLLHILSYSFDPKVKVFQVSKGTKFSEVYMKSVVKHVVMGESGKRSKMGLMVMPGFMIGATVIQSQLREFYDLDMPGLQCIPMRDIEIDDEETWSELPRNSSISIEETKSCSDEAESRPLHEFHHLLVMLRLLCRLHHVFEEGYRERLLVMDEPGATATNWTTRQVSKGEQDM